MGGEQHTLLEWYRIAMQHYHDARYAEAQAAHDQVRRLERGGYCDSILTGMRCFELQRFEDALAHYEHALRLQPGASSPHASDPYPYIYASLALMCLGRPDEALAACDRGSSALPDAQVLYQHKGSLLLELGRCEEALASYEQLLLYDPTSTEALTFKGFALYALGRTSEALDVHEQLLALAPDLPEAHLFKGRVLEQLGSVSEALACYEEAIRLGGATSDAWAYKGGALWQLRTPDGRFLSEALAAYEEAIRLDPGSALAHNGLGNVLMAKRRYREALTAYARASALEPEVTAFQHNRQQAARAAEGLEARDAWSASNRGPRAGEQLMREFQGLQLILKLMEGEQLEVALAACDRARPLVREPGFVEVLLMMKGTILEALARYADAASVYDELIAINPESGDGYYWRARVTLATEPGRDVLPDLELATRLSPTLQEAWVMRADLLAEAKRYAEALAAFEKALALQGGDAMLHTKKGQVLSFLGRYEQALDAFQQAREIEPGQQYHWMNAAVALSQLGRHAESLEAYTAAIQLDPTSPLVPFLLFNRGSELLALRRDAEALASFEAARDHCPDLPDLAGVLANARQAVRRKRAPAAVTGRHGQGSAAGPGQKSRGRAARRGRANEPGRQGEAPHFGDLLIWSTVVAGAVLWLLSWVIAQFGPRLNALVLPFAALCLVLYPLCCWRGWNWRVDKTAGGIASPLLWVEARTGREAGHAPQTRVGQVVSSTRPVAEIWQVRLRRLLHADLFGAQCLLVVTVAAAELLRVDSASLPVSSLVQFVLIGTLLLLLHLASMLAALLVLRALRRAPQAAR